MSETSESGSEIFVDISRGNLSAAGISSNIVNNSARDSYHGIVFCFSEYLPYESFIHSDLREHRSCSFSRAVEAVFKNI
jgi:hypothetical protein